MSPHDTKIIETKGTVDGYRVESWYYTNKSDQERIVELERRVAKLESDILVLCQSINHVSYQAMQGEAAFQQQERGWFAW